MLRVKNLPTDIRCHELETLFKKFGEVLEVKVVWKKDKDLEALLRMAEEKEIKEASEKLDGMKIDEKEIQIEVL